jgi:predicted ribosome quality control (RQC) complex YloA/Tae2 family protein
MTTNATKVRFDGLDVTAMVAELQSLVGQRVVNVYNDDTNGSLYWIKFEQHKANELLVLESGIRVHVSSTGRNTNTTAPSPFCAKLRKHVRGLRLEQLMQLGASNERVICMTFAAPEKGKYGLILELYAQGNLILCDAKNNWEILALLRSHTYLLSSDTSSPIAEQPSITTTTVQVQVGHVYPVTLATTTTSTASTTATSATSKKEGVLSSNEWDRIDAWMQEQLKDAVPTDQSNKKKNKKQKQKNWKWLLLQHSSGYSHYGPALIEHCLLQAGVSPQHMLPLEKIECFHLIETLENEGTRIMESLQQTSPQAGYLLYRLDDDEGGSHQTETSNNDDKDNRSEPAKIYLEFQPYLFRQHQEQSQKLVQECASFSEAVDLFFGQLWQQKHQAKLKSARLAMQNKLQKLEQDQTDRVQSLQVAAEQWQKQARAVQQHAVMVEQALQVVNSALNSGMDWDQLNEIVRVEQENQNLVALLIHHLHLNDNTMVLKLPSDTLEDDDETIKVTLELSETAHSNANRMFAQYRAAKEKAAKTLEKTEQALQAAQQQAQQQFQQQQYQTVRALTKQQHKKAWYEKFLWFITSDNYLVLGGKDAQQNELLVKRYLRKQDLYLHADVAGAASCIVRGKAASLPAAATTATNGISPQALSEAGHWTVCQSVAWKKKMITSAWWVYSHQVSKTAPSGEYLTTGSFMIRGKKNYLKPASLELGLGILFRLGDDDPDTLARHANERKDHFALALLEDQPNNGSVTMAMDNLIIDSGTNETELERLGEEQGETAEGDEANAEDSSVSSNVDNDEKEENIESDGNDSHGNDEDRQDHDVSAGGKTQPKRGLSVKERKLLKKYSSLEEAQRVLNQKKQEQRPSAPTSNSASEKTNIPNDKFTAKRGQRGKAKKKMLKYADQDDEDRELAMVALQGKKNKKNQSKKKVSSKNETEQLVAAETVALLVKDPQEIALKLEDNVRDLLAECVTVGEDEDKVVRWDKFDGDTLEQLHSLTIEAQTMAARRLLNLKRTSRVDHFSASLGGIIRTIKKFGHENIKMDDENDATAAKRKTKEEKVAAVKEWKQTLAEEGVVDLDQEDMALDDLQELGKLTGKPHPEDMILYAVPVLAPYQTLSQYTYRIKLTPGAMKRGKASKQCQEIFLRDDQNKGIASHDRFKEYIKKIPDNDMVQTICADVKISTAGASKLAKQNKSARKKSKNKQ